ncbi:MAG: NUDIX hydrolase [Enterococcus sp.]
MTRLNEIITAYLPYNEQEVHDKELFLTWLASGQEILTRNNPVAHVTASAWIVNPTRTKVLMAHHNLYHSWAWLGGHADGEADLKQVAIKEIKEEAGLTDVRLLADELFSLEILCVNGHLKNDHYVPSHLHLNVTYLFEADEAAPLKPKPDENSALAWIKTAEIADKSNEAWFVEHIYPKLIQKVRALTR